MSDRFLVRLNWILVTLAVLALQLSLHRGGIGAWWSWGEILAVFAISLLATRPWRQAKVVTKGNPPSGVVVLMLTMVMAHIVVEIIFGFVAPPLGQTFELQTALALRNLMIAAAAFSQFPSLLRLSSGLSLTLTCFAFILEIHASITAVVAIYAMIGLWWLIGNYWDRIQGRFPEGTQRSVPKNAGALAIGVALLLGSGMFLLIGGEHATTALSGFMPSSGGNQIDSAAANSGVGDGDDLVNGTEDAMSFGPTESEVFLESQMPSLYDVFNDTYDAPVKRKKPGEHQRSVALAPDKLQHRHQKLARSEQSGRQFSLVRKQSQVKKKSLQDRTSHALLYVKGRTPLHLRMNIYDRLEGDELIEAEAFPPASFVISQEKGKPWLEIPCFVNDSDIDYAEESLLKFINLKSPRVPTPSHFSQLHIPDVDRADLFRWTQDGVLRLDADRIPPTTVMRQRYFLIAEERLQSERYRNKFLAANTPIAAEESSPSLREIAQEWTIDAQPGWETITAVSDHLRNEYLLDRKLPISAATVGPIEEFLFDSRQGPDYLFATSAALLLRELGYQTRIVSGFYASPDRYDSHSEQTPLYPDDAHFWLEVSDGVNWHAVEPTPGYDLLAPPKDLKTRLAEFIWNVLQWSWGYKWTFLLVFTLATTVWLLRIAILDAAARLANCWIISVDHRRRVLRTLQIIQLRERFLPVRRPKGVTIESWLSRKVVAAEEETQQIQSISLCGWALYGGASKCPVPAAEIETLRYFTLELSRRPLSLR
ncbi:transglutaminase-like domain-containing protein [Blastopirellula sp. J2-11]|uniref:transglutaminase-like domain-containing protein n=1 Tax=Blastopirellula sp. J2-11 TaxID=2943192 RepID=UPI0021C5E0C4|nr:transglutaminase-like domain-containing protein [Blastopirellula sp. J2-11]UUO04544.1 transglutaminase-like domain-containing protein [Blastopirellula sp. J2-11]